MNTLEAFNQALFLLINGTTATPGLEFSVASLIADYVIYVVPLLLAGMWLWGSEAQRGLAIRACLVAVLGVGANQLIGLEWQHPRPFMIGLGHTFLPHAPDSSFPSDHATVFAGIALTGIPLISAQFATVTDSKPDAGLRVSPIKISR